MSFILVTEETAVQAQPQPLPAAPQPRAVDPARARAVKPAATASTLQPAPASVTKPMNFDGRLRNRRWTARAPIERMGYVSIDADGTKIPCRLRDISKFGALLEVSHEASHTLPETFVLVFIAGRVRSEANCQRRWSTPDRIGVSFVGPVSTRLAGEEN